MQENLISAKEAAVILDVDVRRIYEMIDDGRIKAYDLNKGRGKHRWIKIPKASVEAFQRSCLISAPGLVQPRYKN